MGVIQESAFSGFTPKRAELLHTQDVIRYIAGCVTYVGHSFPLLPHFSISNLSFSPSSPSSFLFPSPSLPLQIAHMHRLFPQVKKDAIAKILLCCDNNLASAVTKLSSGGGWVGWGGVGWRWYALEYVGTWCVGNLYVCACVCAWHACVCVCVCVCV